MNTFFFNFRFRVDNHDHIIDVNQGKTSNNPSEYDQVNILCPFYDRNTTPNIEDTERFYIFHVNREEYEMCRIMRANPKVIGLCNNPYRFTFYTVSFRSFSPSPGALEFHPGKDYYFMTTSSKDDLTSRSGGLCRTHNMKVVFKVADISIESKEENSKVTPVQAPPPVKPLQQDNQLFTPQPPSLRDQNEVESKESLDKKERRRRRKKEKAERKNKKKLSSETVPPYGSELSPYLNDNPKFRQKEPSEVERVNNLMAKKDPFFAGGNVPKMTSSLTSIFMSLTITNYAIIIMFQ